MNEKELILIGIEWLSSEIEFRNILDKGSQSPAIYYSNAEMRTIRRVRDFISLSKSNLQWFHDALLLIKVEPEIWQLFFRIWSTEYHKVNDIESKILG